MKPLAVDAPWAAAAVAVINMSRRNAQLARSLALFCLLLSSYPATARPRELVKQPTGSPTKEQQTTAEETAETKEAPEAEADSPTLDLSLTWSYDGSQHRIGPWGVLPAFSLALSDDLYLGGYLNITTHTDLQFRLANDVMAGAWLNWELGTHFAWAWETEIELSGPSYMSGSGLDLQLSLTSSKEITDNIFTGIQVAAVAATAPLEDDNLGYLSSSGWIGYRGDFLTEDKLSVGYYAATHESPGYGNLFILEARYTATPASWQDWELMLAVGKEITTPYEHDSFYWGFSLTKSF